MDPATLASLGKAAGETTKALAQPAMDLGMYYLQRHHAKKDYERMRADNLSDFNMANKYNSPEEQMNRLRQAGLNPHLVYGKGADMASVQMKGADLDTPKAPQMAPIKDYLATKQSEQIMQQMGGAIKLQQAQTDNVMADTQNKQSQNDLMQLEVISKQIKNAVDGIERDKLIALYDDMLERYRTENDLMSADLNLKDQAYVLNLERNDREWIASATNQSEAIQRIAESKIRQLEIKSRTDLNERQKELVNKQIENYKSIIKLSENEVLLKQIQVALEEQGIPKDSPWYWRMIVKMKDNAKEWIEANEKNFGQEYVRQKFKKYREDYDERGYPKQRQTGGFKY